MDSELILHLDENSMSKEELAKHELILVDFWAPWCAPCRMVAPILEQVAVEYKGKITIGKLNTDENPNAARAFAIQGIPTMALFKKGVEINRIVGAHGKNAIAQIIDEALK